MLTLLAHAGELRPHDLWTAWPFDPLVLAGVVGAAVVHARGRRPGRDERRRRLAFTGALVTIAVALLSPLDPLAGVLLSAHMVQHVLLVLVAAPLLAIAAPGPELLRGLPGGARRATRTLRRRAGVSVGVVRWWRHPVLRWLLFVATLWLWHAAALYSAAVEHDAVHALEHVSFLATATLVWSSVLGPVRVRVSRGFAVLGVFALALQSTFLSVLLTFARAPWYEPYATPAPGWDVDPLADQQLAGVLMWIPAGLLHAGIGLALLVSWFRELDPPAPRARPADGSVLEPT